MDDKAPPPIWKVMFGAWVIMSVVFGLLILQVIEQNLGAGLIILALALASGPLIIWRFVRSINDRDDPRRRKPPPGPP